MRQTPISAARCISAGLPRGHHDKRTCFTRCDHRYGADGADHRRRHDSGRQHDAPDGRTAESVAAGRAHFDVALAFMVEHEVVSAGEAASAAGLLRLATDVATAAEADLVIESIVEHLPTKQPFFRTLDDLCPPSAILATNTSGLRITEITALMQHPDRAVTTHFWNPGHLMPLVEVIQGERTSEETVHRAYRFLLRCGKRPVIGRKELPGQICNRLQQALIREAIYMVQEGIASADDVEEALKAGAGLRGPSMGHSSTPMLSGPSCRWPCRRRCCRACAT